MASWRSAELVAGASAARAVATREAETIAMVREMFILVLIHVS